MVYKDWGKDDKSLSFSIVAYEESLPEPIKYIIEDLPYCIAYAYIYHDSDIDENGKLKKPHYHIYLKMGKYQRYQSIAKKFGIACNNELIRSVKNYIKLVRYMAHYDDPDKFQYPINEIVAFNVNIDECFKRYILDKESEEHSAFSLILDFITNEDKVPSNYQIIMFCLENGLISTYRRNYQVFKDLIKDIR